MGLRWGDRRHRSGPPGLTDPAVPSLFSLGREHPPRCCHATKSDQITGLSWPISSFRGSEILASIFDVPWKKAREGEDGARGWSQAALWAQTHRRHCHRLGKTNTNRSCLKEEGLDRASDSNTAPTSASPLGQTSAQEQTATRSFRDKQELKPLISLSCTAERAAKLFSSSTSSSSPSKTVTLLLPSLQPLSHGPGREKGRQNLFGVHLLPKVSQRGKVDGQAQEQDRDMWTPGLVEEAGSALRE